MTKAELNRDIKRLWNEIYRLSFEDGEQYTAYLEGEGRKEFMRIYDADKEFEYMNHQSLKMVLDLNRRFQWVPFHRFGMYMKVRG